MQISEHVGKRIRLYRKQRNLTLKEFAADINKSISTVSKYESGKIPIDIETLFDIADSLQISVNQLIDYQEKKPSERRQNMNNYFERCDLFYMYQYFPPEKKIYCSALEITRRIDEPDKVTMYYDFAAPADYTQASYIYHGTIECYDTVATMLMNNPYNRSDVVFVYAKSPFTAKETTNGILTGLSSSRRNPYAYKVIFSYVPLKLDDDLKGKLICTDKEGIADFKRYNSLFVY